VNDFLPEAEFAELLRKWFGNMSRALLPGRGFYAWGGYGNLGNYPPALAESGLYFSQGIVWNKCHPVLTRKDLWVPSRLPSTAGRKVRASVPRPEQRDRSVGDQEGQPAVDGASHGEARRARARAIQYSSRPGENVLDLFGGSGSTPDRLRADEP